MAGSGGCFLPNEDYDTTGNWTFAGNVTVNGTLTDSGSTLASPAITGTVSGAAAYTTPTLTTPVISTGLTASGSAANTFAGSTGTFITSSGANTLSGAVSIADATTPSLTTATGKTNTGFVTILGKTSGGFKLFTADATGQTVTLAPIAQTVGASTLSIPDMAGSSDTLVFQALSQALTKKIYSDNKYIAEVTYDNTSTLATITGLSWTVVAGATYAFDIVLSTIMTTNGGLKVAFTLTTATLSAIRYNTYQSTAADNSTAVSSTGTTTTSATAMVNNKDAAYTTTRIYGTFVVGTGGTLVFQAAQNTAASGADVSTINVGSYCLMQRIA